jgi:hypothetical protein
MPCVALQCDSFELLKQPQKPTPKNWLKAVLFIDMIVPALLCAEVRFSALECYPTNDTFSNAI